MLIKKILVATDFSESADAAVKYAIKLAKETQASLTLLHSYQTLPYTESVGLVSFEPRLHESLRSSAKTALLEAQAEATGSGLSQVEIAVEQGAPFDVITRFAKEGHYDLIIVGTHGRTGIRHALLGSVAERVVRHAHCPVLVVRQPEEAPLVGGQDHGK